MHPLRAIASALRQYATFRGVASRPEYWWWIISTGLVTQALAWAAGATSREDTFVGEVVSVIDVVVALAIVIPTLAVTVRRFHDAGFSGKWLLLYVIPALSIFLTARTAIPVVAELVQPGLAADRQATLVFSLFSIAAPPVILAFAVWVFCLIITLMPSKTAEAGNRHFR